VARQGQSNYTPKGMRMDPDQTFDAVITFVMNGEFGEAAAALNDLKQWCERGGFPPQDPRPHFLSAMPSGDPQRPGVGWTNP
jgi:hypothetical protein